MAEEIERENSRRTIELQSAARIGLAATISSPMLSDTTRRNRKMLILSSAVVLLMVWVGIVPEEIKTIGVTFEPSGQRSLVVSGGLVVLYFLVMFLVV